MPKGRGIEGPWLEMSVRVLSTRKSLKNVEAWGRNLESTLANCRLLRLVLQMVDFLGV